MIRNTKTNILVYAMSRLMEIILGTTTKNMTGKTNPQVSLKDASLKFLSFVFIINRISDAPKVNVRKLEDIESIWLILKDPV